MPPRDGDLRFAHLHHRAYFTQDGRAPANAATFAQVSTGALWVGGFRGLSTFNGLQWIATTPGRQALDSRSVARLVADGDDALWIGLQDGRVMHIGGQAARTYERGDGIPQGSIVTLFRDRDGNPWIVNRRGMAWFAADRWHSLSLPDQPGAIAGAFADREGAVWVLLVSGDLYRRTAGSTVLTLVAKVSLPPAARASIVQTRDGSLWIAAGRGGVTQVIEPASAEPATRTWFEQRSPSILLADRAGHLWMGGGEGLQLLNEQAIRELKPSREPRLDEFDVRDGLSGNSIRAMYEDRDGLVWVSTDRGIDRFFHSEFVGFPLPRDFRGSKTLLALDDGTLWVADKEAASIIGIRDNRIVHRFDGQSFTAATRDSRDRAWFGGASGLLRIEKDQRRQTPLPDGAEGNAVIAMAVDFSDRLWLSVADIGLFVRHQEGSWQRADVTGLPEGAPTALRVDDRGDLWLAYDINLMFRLRQGKLHRFTAEDGLSAGRITTMDWEHQRMWLGGDSGIDMIEADLVRKVRARNCPAFNAVSGILKTRGGYWQYHGSILSFVDESHVNPASADETVWITCDTFNFADTIPGNLQTAPSQPLAQSRDQRLWFAAGGKLIYKDLTAPFVKVSPPKAMLVDIAERSSVDPLRRFELHAPTQDMELPPGNQSLSFRFVAWQLWAAERLRFQYRLVGVDEDWKFTQTPWHIAYNNLPPGRYVFQFAANNGGEDWPEPSELRFSIKPYFHQTWWFYSLCGLVVLAVIALIFQLQLRRVSNRLRARLSERLLERERIARELHDTLLQGFQGLILRFQGVASRIPRDQPARGQLEGLLDDADKVLIESRDRVSELRQSPYESGELPEAIADAARKLAAGLGIDTQMTVAGAARDIDVGVHAETFLIAREALSNAIRHSGAKNVIVKLEYERHALRLTIRDDGVGIDEAVLHAGGKPGHWGIQGMQERAKRLKASLLFRRCREGGTEIELRIPASVAFTST